MTAADQAAKVFKALSEPPRLLLLAVLTGGTELTVSAAAELSGLDYLWTSHHLLKLRHAGLAEVRQDGRFRRYTLTPAGERAARTAAEFLEAK